MRNKVKNACARLLRGLTRRLDERMPETPAVGLRELEKFFACIQRLAFQPKHIVDVGANRGQWTRTALRYFPNAHFTMLEPQIAMKDHLRDLLLSNSRIQLHSVGAGVTEGESEFTLAERDDSCTFSMTSEQAAELGLEQVRVPVVSLDRLLAQSAAPPPEMLKIDAEGYDLEVIQGAKTVIQSCEVVFVEVGVMCKGLKNDLRTVVNAMASLGFRPCDVTDLNRPWKNGSLWLMELAFIRVDGTLDRLFDEVTR